MEVDNTLQTKKKQLVVNRKAAINIIDEELAKRLPVLVGLSYSNNGEPSEGVLNQFWFRS